MSAHGLVAALIDFGEPQIPLRGGNNLTSFDSGGMEEKYGGVRRVERATRI
jgi:hypothetical protein